MPTQTLTSATTGKVLYISCLPRAIFEESLRLIPMESEDKQDSASFYQRRNFDDQA